MLKFFKTNKAYKFEGKKFDMELSEDFERMKKKFQEKFSKSDASGTSENLKSFQFMTILGQGAFGIVVSYFINFHKKNK